MFLLAIADFSHSELKILLPQKHGLESNTKEPDAHPSESKASVGQSGKTAGGEGLSNAAKNASFDDALHELADFRNAQFEANTALSQGTFSLKRTEWPTRATPPMFYFELID